MKKKFILIYSFFVIFSLYSENKFEDFSCLNLYNYTEHTINNHGWLEYEKLKDTSFSECNVISINGLKEIPCILYYQIETDSNNKTKGMFEINNQEFVFNDFRFSTSEIEIITVSFNNTKYLLFLGDQDKYGDKICFIFDITNPKHILFYPVENKIIDNNLIGTFVVTYKNKLCFLFSERIDNSNLYLKLSPYTIEDNVLKEICDENGHSYFINYLYTSRYKQEYIIKEKNIP